MSGIECAFFALAAFGIGAAVGRYMEARRWRANAYQVQRVEGSVLI